MSISEPTAAGRNVRRLRKELGLSQHELANRSGVSRPTIANLELGVYRFNTTRTIEKLACALGVTIADLYLEHPRHRKSKTGRSTDRNDNNRTTVR